MNRILIQQDIIHDSYGREWIVVTEKGRREVSYWNYMDVVPMWHIWRLSTGGWMVSMPYAGLAERSRGTVCETLDAAFTTVASREAIARLEA